MLPYQELEKINNKLVSALLEPELQKVVFKITHYLLYSIVHYTPINLTVKCMYFIMASKFPQWDGKRSVDGMYTTFS